MHCNRCGHEIYDTDNCPTDGSAICWRCAGSEWSSTYPTAWALRDLVTAAARLTVAYLHHHTRRALRRTKANRP